MNLDDKKYIAKNIYARLQSDGPMARNLYKHVKMI